MRHRKSGRKLKRTATHRKALLAALSTGVLRHRRIKTTFAKAKEAQRVVERLITKAKRSIARESDGKAGDLHGRREVARIIKDRAVVKSLFEEIAPKVATRQGGYTRVVKLGQRRGDAAELALLELVDFSGAAAAGAKEEKSPKAKSKSKGTSGKAGEEKTAESKAKPTSLKS